MRLSDRNITLPDGADVSKLQAEYKDGGASLLCACCTESLFRYEAAFRLCARLIRRVKMLHDDSCPALARHMHPHWFCARSADHHHPEEGVCQEAGAEAHQRQLSKPAAPFPLVALVLQSAE